MRIGKLSTGAYTTIRLYDIRLSDYTTIRTVEGTTVQLGAIVISVRIQFRPGKVSLNYQPQAYKGQIPELSL